MILRQEAVIRVPEHVIPGGWVVGGVTRLLDVWSESPLVLRAPAFRYPEHPLTFVMEESAWEPARRARSGLSRILPSSPARESVSLGDSDLCVDVRHDTNGNVAHVLQNQIAVGLSALGAFGLGARWRDLVFVVGAETPGYAVRLFEALGFRVLATDAAVRGRGLRMEPRKFPLRAIAVPVLRAHAEAIGLLSGSDGVEDPVFLARRGRRTLTNMEEIEPIVNRAGFRTVFAEDLSAEDQIRTVSRAGAIFGLHGAAMGYSMFRGPRAGGIVVECFPSGYATNWCRAICAMSGDTWVGGQGDLKLGVVSGLLNGSHPRDHESDDFRLDPRTAEILVGTRCGSSRDGWAAQLEAPCPWGQTVVVSVPQIAAR